MSAKMSTRNVGLIIGLGFLVFAAAVFFTDGIAYAGPAATTGGVIVLLTLLFTSADR